MNRRDDDIRAAAAKIKPRDLLAAVEKFRQLDQGCIPHSRVVSGHLGRDLTAGSECVTVPLRPTHQGDLSQDQFQNQIAGDFRAQISVTFGQFTLQPSEHLEGKS